MQERRRGSRKGEIYFWLIQEVANNNCVYVTSSDRNWLEFLSILDGTFSPITRSKSDGQPSNEAREICKSQIEEARAFFEEITDKDGHKDRSAWLALVDLAQRERLNGLGASG